MIPVLFLSFSGMGFGYRPGRPALFSSGSILELEGVPRIKKKNLVRIPWVFSVFLLPSSLEVLEGVFAGQKGLWGCTEPVAHKRKSTETFRVALGQWLGHTCGHPCPPPASLGCTLHNAGLLARLEFFSVFRPPPRTKKKKTGRTHSLRSPVVKKTQFLSDRSPAYLPRFF
jgi:hypothetical protein